MVIDIRAPSTIVKPSVSESNKISFHCSSEPHTTYGEGAIVDNKCIKAGHGHCGFYQEPPSSRYIWGCEGQVRCKGIVYFIASFARPAEQVDSKLRSSFERISLYGRE